MFPICRRKSTINNRFAGFTLTEVITASAILAVAMVPILKGLTAAHLNSATIERKTHSLTLAQGKLDEIKARSVYRYTETFTENDLSLGGSYLCNVAYTSDGPNRRKLTVSVGYDLNDNEELESDEILVTLNTLVAKRW